MRNVVVNFENYEFDELTNVAKAKGVPLTAYLHRLAVGENRFPMFTTSEVIKRYDDKLDDGIMCRSDVFRVKDLFTEEEWATFDDGPKGVFLRSFHRYVEKHDEEIGIYFTGSTMVLNELTYTGIQPPPESYQTLFEMLFNPEETVRRAMQLSRGTKFSLSDLYTEEEWEEIPTRLAGHVGRRFLKEIKGKKFPHIIVSQPYENGYRVIYKVV